MVRLNCACSIEDVASPDHNSCVARWTKGRVRAWSERVVATQGHWRVHHFNGYGKGGQPYQLPLLLLEEQDALLHRLFARDVMRHNELHEQAPTSSAASGAMCHWWATSQLHGAPVSSTSSCTLSRERNSQSAD